jgi:hypothetical protein
MRVRKKRAPRREGIDVRRLRLRVAAEAADPIVQVIDRDEEHVRRRGGLIGLSDRICDNSVT